MTALLLGALQGCATQGARYPAVVTETGPPPSGHTRIVLLRPNDRYDDYSLSRAVIRMNDRALGTLAYGGFLFADVTGDEVVISASARNRWYGTCELRLRTNAGDTVYVDVAPRPANIAAEIAGAAVGGAAVGGTATHAGVEEILVDKGAAQVAAASAAGSAAASAIEAAGKQCGGPYRLKPVDASAALKQLDKLSWSR